MIPKYIAKWLQIIEQMNNDNTYKLAWGRAVVECVTFNYGEEDGNNVIIKFNDISKCMLKYYWNQSFFFNLKQSPYKDKAPKITRLTDELISNYKIQTGSNIPTWFDEESIKKLNESLYNKTINNISKALHENVSWRFKNVPDEVLEIYTYYKSNSQIVINKQDAELLKDYSVVISKLLNYKWAQLLEKFNFQPKIATKVSAISDNKIRRNSLSKYKEELLKEFNGNPIDFYTGKPLALDDISVDHVLPWSFVYSDDIWNLVLTSKSNNSRKSNSIPTQEDIDRLIERNKKLLNVVSDSFKLDIEESIKREYINKLYFECRL